MSVIRHHPKSPSSSALFAVVMLLALAAASPSAAQIDIETVIVSSGPSYLDGVVTDYFIEPLLSGSGIASVRLFRENGAFIDLIEDPPGTWGCLEGVVGNCEFFPTLQDVRDLGDLTFTVTGTLGGSDSILIPFEDWDPATGGTGPPTGFPEITSPTNGELGVSLTPTFTWNAPPAWVDVIFAEVLVSTTGDLVDEVQLLATDTSWQPVLIQEGVLHELGVSFFSGIIVDDPRVSPQSDAYLFTSAYQAFSFVPFTTEGFVPLPLLHGFGAGVLVFGLIASARAALRRRTSG